MNFNIDLKSIDLKNISLDDIKAKLQKVEKKTWIKIGTVAGAVVFFLIIFYGVLNPIVNKKKAQLDDMNKKIEETIELTVDSQQPDWYKKAWRGVMMQVHPDRLDLVSKDELDKLERLQIASRLRNNSDPELLVACCNTLEVNIDLATYEQERMLRVSTKNLKEELKNMQSSLPWLWAESIVDNNSRAQLMKQVLQNSGYNPPDDIILIQYITKNVIQ